MSFTIDSKIGFTADTTSADIALSRNGHMLLTPLDSQAAFSTSELRTHEGTSASSNLNCFFVLFCFVFLGGKERTITKSNKIKYIVSAMFFYFFSIKGRNTEKKRLARQRNETKRNEKQHVLEFLRCRVG